MSRPSPLPFRPGSRKWLTRLLLPLLCHDLGKSQLPHDILIKGDLDPAEKAAMEKHPVYGVRLLLNTPGVE